MARHVDASGPTSARILIVGEAPGENEELEGRPFVGAAGQELTRMLREAGIRRDDCRITNVCPYRPPANKIDKWLLATKTKAGKAAVANGWATRAGYAYSPEIAEGLEELRAEIASCRPEIVIGLGNVPLWALTSEWGVTKWRGSQMMLPGDITFVPTLHPASILRQWGTRHLAVADMKRAVANPQAPAYTFIDKPKFGQAFDYINQIRSDDWVSLDVETGNGRIVCIGIARGPYEALCLPLMTADGPYWSDSDEKKLIGLLRERLAFSFNIGQNFTYDASYFEADFGWHPTIDFDTYIAQSVLWPGESRGLGFLSSIYCRQHRYWKDDAKEWFKLKSAADYDRLFKYNCEDAARTFEIAQRQQEALKVQRLTEQFQSRQRYDANVFAMQARGVMRDPKRTKQLEADIDEAIHARELFIAESAGHPVNFRSPKQVADLFYKELGCKPVTVRVAKSDERRVSTGDEALEELVEKYPEHRELATDILECRSLASLRSNFLRAKLDPDGRLRSGFTSCGTETFRLTSGKNAFDRGCNLLNVTKKASGVNLRSCIVPDPGYTYFDCDLARADLQVVVWEADDAQLKTALRDGVDIHLVNAIDLYGIRGIPYDECFESHPRYLDHIARVGTLRDTGKRFVHLTDYGGKARKCASACGLTVHEAETAQRRWFALHPGFLEWHRATAARLNATRSVMNRFGYRRTYFDRVESLLPEALAWVPQSTVALVISEIHRRFDLIRGVEVQIQCYDSLAGQYLTKDEPAILAAMHEAASVVVPYRDPLIIPLGLSTGPSWGECKSRHW